MMPAGELNPGIKPEDTKKDCKKSIFYFSWKLYDACCNEEETQNQQSIGQYVNDRMSTPLYDFKVHKYYEKQS